MSFIRKKLSSVWDRSSDESSRSSLENHRNSISSGHSGYSSNITPSLLGSISEVSPGRLHKAASTTFQAFSDTIRAKAQIFYTHPSRPESAGPDSPETKTPRKHGQRTPIWSSARSRQRLADRNNPGGTPGSPGTPTTAQGRPSEPAPALDVKIPSSSLTELRADDGFAVESSAMGVGNQTTNKEDYTPKRLWPSQHTASPRSPIVNGLINPAKLSSLMDDPYTEHSSEVAYDSTMFEPCRSASNAGKHRGKNDEGYMSDVESNTNPIASDGFSPASVTSQYYFTTSTATAAKSPHNGSSLFVKGDQARVHFQQTPSPFQRAKPSQESPLASAITGELSPYSPLESPLTVVRSESLMPYVPKDPIGTAGLLVPPDSPLAHRSNSFVRSSGGSSLTASTIESAETLGYSRLPSYVYEAEAESAASSPGTPNMGSRHAWNETLADRNDRYLAIHSMSETTNSDEESDPELGLSRSPLRKPIHSLEEEGGVSLIEGTVKARLDIPERSDAETRKLDSRNSSLQKKLEALELLESSCDASTDSEFQVSNSPPESTLRIFMEANNRVSGTVIDEFEDPARALPGEASLYSEGQIGNVVDSVLAELDSLVAESPKRILGHALVVENTSVADQEALETPVLTSSSDKGRQSYKDIQEVTNTELNDEEFEDVVQRTNKLHQLHLQHKHNPKKRSYAREPRKIMSMVGQGDAFQDSSPNAELFFPGPNVSKVASRNASTTIPLHSENDELSRDSESDVVGDTVTIDIPVMDREKSVSFNIAEDIDGSSSVQKVQPADREGVTDALRSVVISRRFLEKGKVSKRNPPTTPVEHPRSFSTESARTTDSCAITTSSPLCYAPLPFPPLHVRSSPVRRTSSIIAGLESQDDEDNKDSSTEPRADERTSTPDILEIIVQKRLNLENASSPAEHSSPNASSIPAASSSLLATRAKPQSTLEKYLELPEPLCSFELDPSTASPGPAAHGPSIVGEAKPKKSRERAFPFKLEEDKDEELSTMEEGEASPKKARLDTEDQVLGETTGNKGKKKRKSKRKNRKSKSEDASLEPVKSATMAPLGTAPGSITPNVSSLTTLYPTNDEYQTSSHEKGVWWSRNCDVVGDGESPLAEKKTQREETRVDSEGARSAEKEGNTNVGSGLQEKVILG